MCSEAPGATVTVDVRGKFRLITPILAFVFGGQDLPLDLEATAQIEYLPDTATATPPPAPVAEFTGHSHGRALRADGRRSTRARRPATRAGFQWDFDGNGIVDSIDPNPTHTYATAGTYTVKLTVVNLAGVDSR